MLVVIREMAVKAQIIIKTFPYPILALKQLAWKPMNHGPGRGYRKYFVKTVELADSSSLLAVDHVQTS